MIVRPSESQPPIDPGHCLVRRAAVVFALMAGLAACAPTGSTRAATVPDAAIRTVDQTAVTIPERIEAAGLSWGPDAEAEGPFVTLPVPGFGDAVVSVPADTSRPKPVLVAAHGAGDKPSWQCEVWRSIVGDRGFVLCPRGTAMSWGIPGQDLGYFFRNHHALERELIAVLEAFRGRFGRRADPGPVVFAGYSQGGIMGALAVVEHPATFSRLILVEGGEAEWDVPTAIRFREGGGQRVLLVCGRPSCDERALRSSWWLRRGGVEVRREMVHEGGHTYGGRVAQRLAETFAWVVEGDERWGDVDASLGPALGR